MDLTSAIGIISAAVVTVLGTALAARPTWSSGLKRAISGGAAIVLGIIAAVATGQVSTPDGWQDWIGHALISVAGVIALAQGFHRQWEGALTKLSAATSPAAVAAPGDHDAAHAGPDDDTIAAAAPAPTHAADDSPSVIPDGEGVATSQS